MSERYYVGQSLYKRGLEWLNSKTGSGFVIVGANSGLESGIQISRFQELKKRLKEMGLRFIELDGLWHDPETGDEAHEASLFVPYWECQGYSFDDFIDDMTEVGNSFDQEAIIYANREKIWLLWLKTGLNEELGAIHPETLNQAYSRMSGLIDSKRVFIFRGVRTPKNIIEALAMELEGYLIQTSFTVKNKPFRFG